MILLAMRVVVACLVGHGAWAGGRGEKLLPVWVIHDLGWASPYGPPKGLIVHLHVRTGQRIPGIEPLLVRVEATGVYVNSRLVRREDLESVLRNELTLRPQYWPVYLEGGQDVNWGAAVTVMDIIRGLGAQVVLLTPGYRAP